MKRVEFYNRMTDIINRNRLMYLKNKDEYDRMEADKASGKYSPEYIEKMRLQQYDLLRDMTGIKKTAEAELKSLVDEMHAYLRELDALNPAELTDDVKLLDGNIPLKTNDLQSMLNRNADNRSMTQIIMRYAKEHNIEGIDYHSYASAEDQMYSIKQMASSAHMVMEWYDNPKAFNNMYNSCIGEGSDLYAFCHGAVGN